MIEYCSCIVNDIVSILFLTYLLYVNFIDYTYIIKDQECQSVVIPFLFTGGFGLISLHFENNIFSKGKPAHEYKGIIVLCKVANSHWARVKTRLKLSNLERRSMPILGRVSPK